MKVKELMESLAEVDPEAEVVGGVWNGRTNTYRVLDNILYADYDAIYADFFGTPGYMDERVFDIRSQKVLYIGSEFPHSKATEEIGFVCSLQEIAEDEDIPDGAKGKKLLKMLNEFSNGVDIEDGI